MDIPEIKKSLTEHHQAGFMWALRCCAGNAAEAEDVLQTVYLKVLEGRAKFGGRSAFKTWFFSVIFKTAADVRRKGYFRRMRLEKYQQEIAVADSSVSAETDEHEQALQALFKQALSELPQRQQQVLDLVFYHDLTIQEASEIMKISIGSARTHYDRGKKQLRRIIENSQVWQDEQS